jgi:type III secretion system low calcium response chaperone LcrH/SycD
VDKLKSYLLKGDFKKKGSLKEIAGVLLMGGTVQEVFKLSNQVLEKYYQTSERLLQQKRYEEASDAFFFLIYLNPYYHSFWVCLGLAEQGKGHYSDALFAYLIAQATKKEDPIPYLNAAKCFLALGEKEVAAENIDHAIHYCEREYEVLKSEAEKLKQVCAL